MTVFFSFFFFLCVNFGLENRNTWTQWLPAKGLFFIIASNTPMASFRIHLNALKETLAWCYYLWLPHLVAGLTSPDPCSCDSPMWQLEQHYPILLAVTALAAVGATSPPIVVAVTALYGINRGSSSSIRQTQDCVSRLTIAFPSFSQKFKSLREHIIITKGFQPVLFFFPPSAERMLVLFIYCLVCCRSFGYQGMADVHTCFGFHQLS